MPTLLLYFDDSTPKGKERADREEFGESIDRC